MARLKARKPGQPRHRLEAKRLWRAGGSKARYWLKKKQKKPSFLKLGLSVLSVPDDVGDIYSIPWASQDRELGGVGIYGCTVIE